MSDDDEIERLEYSDNASEYDPNDSYEENDDDDEDEDEEEEEEVKEDRSRQVSSSQSSTRRVTTTDQRILKNSRKEKKRRIEKKKGREASKETELVSIVDNNNKLVNTLYECSQKLNEEYGHINAIFATKSKGISLDYNCLCIQPKSAFN